MKVWLLNNDMLKRHLGDLALTSERGTLHNTVEWSDNKIGNIEMEELDEIKDGLRNMQSILEKVLCLLEVLRFSILNSPKID